MCLKKLYMCAKPLFLENILKDLDFILDNKLLKDIEVFDLTIPQKYDMENLKKVL